MVRSELLLCEWEYENSGSANNQDQRKTTLTDEHSDNKKINNEYHRCIGTGEQRMYNKEVKQINKFFSTNGAAHNLDTPLFSGAS